MVNAAAGCAFAIAGMAVMIDSFVGDCNLLHTAYVVLDNTLSLQASAFFDSRRKGLKGQSMRLNAKQLSFLLQIDATRWFRDAAKLSSRRVRRLAPWRGRRQPKRTLR